MRPEYVATVCSRVTKRDHGTSRESATHQIGWRSRWTTWMWRMCRSAPGTGLVFGAAADDILYGLRGFARVATNCGGWSRSTAVAAVCLSYEFIFQFHRITHLTDLADTLSP